MAYGGLAECHLSAEHKLFSQCCIWIWMMQCYASLASPHNPLLTTEPCPRFKVKSSIYCDYFHFIFSNYTEYYIILSIGNTEYREYWEMKCWPFVSKHKHGYKYYNNLLFIGECTTTKRVPNLCPTDNYNDTDNTLLE